MENLILHITPTPNAINSYVNIEIMTNIIVLCKETKP